MSQYQYPGQYRELEELEAVLASQELLAFEGIDISEHLREEFDKRARFQKPTTVNEIKRRERIKQNSKKKKKKKKKLNKVPRGR